MEDTRSQSAECDRPKRLLVNRHDARRMLGGIGDSKLYELFHRGEIEGVFIDNKRLFSVQSIEDYVARLSNVQPDGIARRVGNLKYCESVQADAEAGK